MTICFIRRAPLFARPERYSIVSSSSIQFAHLSFCAKRTTNNGRESACSTQSFALYLFALLFLLQRNVAAGASKPRRTIEAFCSISLWRFERLRGRRSLPPFLPPRPYLHIIHVGLAISLHAEIAREVHTPITSFIFRRLTAHHRMRGLGRLE